MKNNLPIILIIIILVIIIIGFLRCCLRGKCCGRHIVVPIQTSTQASPIHTSSAPTITPVIVPQQSEPRPNTVRCNPDKPGYDISGNVNPRCGSIPVPARPTIGNVRTR